MSKLRARVDELEKHKKAAPVFAVRYDDEEIARVTHTGELLTLEQLESKYPDATIIHVVYKALKPVEPVFGDLRE